VKMENANTVRVILNLFPRNRRLKFAKSRIENLKYTDESILHGEDQAKERTDALGKQVELSQQEGEKKKKKMTSKRG